MSLASDHAPMPTNDALSLTKLGYLLTESW